MLNRNTVILLKLYKIVILLLTTGIAFSQNIPFKHLIIEDGLSNNQIFDIIQDKTGFIWLATDDGLNRFDGYNFKIYRKIPNDPTSLSDNSIWTLYEDKTGFIWIGTKSGELNRYDPKTNKFIHWEIKSEFVKENSITAIYEDRFGAIWVGTYKSGLYRFDPVTEKIEIWRNDPQNKYSLSNNYVTSIIEDTEGNLLISTYIGLNKFNYKKSKNYFTHFFNDSHNPNTISNNLIWSISKSDYNPDLIWIGTADGLNSYHSATNTFSRIQISNPQNLQFGFAAGNVIEEMIGDEKILWIDSYAGLLRINESTGQTIRYLSQKNSFDYLSSNQINKIFRDKSGVTWIATDNGLNYFSSKSTKFNNILSNKFGLLDFSELRDKNVTAITQTSNGTIWFGTNNGLYKTSNTDGTTFLKKYAKLDGIHIWSLTSEGSDNLWVGTYGAGLMFLDVKKDQIIKQQFDHKKLQTQSVLFNKSLFFDGQNNLWIGYWGLGLAKLNSVTGDFKLWQNTANNNPNGISHNDVWTIYSDSKNRMWVGTNGGGLNLFIDEGEGKFIRWLADDNQLNSISGNSIYAIVESKNNGQTTDPSKIILWVGTNEGLNKLLVTNSIKQNKKFEIIVEITKYSIEEGLADKSIKAILEDADGNLWLGTNSGITLFDIKKNKFTNFTKADGIIGSDINTAASLKTKSGMMLFGSTSGLNYFDSQHLKLSTYKTPIVITDFKIFNESVIPDKSSPLNYNITNTKEIILEHSQNVFSFEFAALDFNSPQSIQYAYMMEGFDADWINSGSRRFVTYTNLGAGKYKFKVRATNADGIWNEHIAELSVIIKSPWWATSWAYILYVLIIIVGLYTIRRFELNRSKLKSVLRMREYEAVKQKELDETKSRFFANLSHEFRTPLMLIKGPLEQLMEDKSNGKNIERFKMIYRNTENLKTLIDQLLELTQLEAASISLKAKKQNLLKHIQGLAYTFKELADDKNIHLSFNTTEDSLTTWIDSDKLEKIINNLLSNSLKFTSKGGEVSIDVVKIFLDEKEYAEIKISDTGIGIPAQKLDRIFDRFYQVDDSNQRTYGGSGIGLALVKELVDLHKWDISVTSEINKGTQFSLRIPLWDNYLAENQKVKSEVIDDPKINMEINNPFQGNNLLESEGVDEEIVINNKPSILIVEDSSDVRLYLLDLLKSDYVLLKQLMVNRE
ncbi:MAG: hypothetical protein IPJ23_11155 [Ignavibacteriales bacterium]|nr:hypothetical protein [Ignavibacteriales bacterium]